MIAFPRNISKAGKRRLAVAALAAAIGIGFFLRAYRHDDLARFGKDQARDASMVRDVAEGRTGWPFLGPKAGGTDFKMGPAYYYLEIVAGGIFGIRPPALAYPELLLSVAAIPMLFFLLRLRFSAWPSLLATFLYAVSFYAVQNGRFAWNPNSLPFFSMLSIYAILKLADGKERRKLLWSLVLGLSFGIGVQLHTIYLLVFSAVIAIFGLRLAIRRDLSPRNAGAFLLMALLLNAPQIYSEFRNDWGNSKSFLAGIGRKEAGKNSVAESLAVDAGWIAQSGIMFVAPAGDDTRLHAKGLADSFSGKKGWDAGKLKEDWPDAVRVACGTLIFLAGACFLALAAARSKDESGRNFYRIMVSYLAVAFIVYLPLSHVMELRYMLILEPLPFVMIGAVLDFSAKRHMAFLASAITAGIVALAIWNVWSVNEYLFDLKADDDNNDIAIWSEEECLGKFILSRTAAGQEIRMAYLPTSSGKFVRPLSYFDDRLNDGLLNSKKTAEDGSIDGNAAYFSVILDSDRKQEEFRKAVAKGGAFAIAEDGSCGRISAYRLEPLRD